MTTWVISRYAIAFDYEYKVIVVYKFGGQDWNVAFYQHFSLEPELWI